MWFVGQTLCGSPDRPSLNVQKLKNWATLGKYFLLQKQHNLQRLQITVCNDCRLRFATIADYDLQRLQITICNDCRLYSAYNSLYRTGYATSGKNKKISKKSFNRAIKKTFFALKQVEIFSLNLLFTRFYNVQT